MFASSKYLICNCTSFGGFTMNYPTMRTLGRLAAVAFIALYVVIAHAQTTNVGAITGTITDSSGAVVPKATVTVTNQGTKDTHTVTSTDRGFYSVENLPDGDYIVSTQAPGFQQSDIANLHLDPGQRRGQDIKLSIGDVNTKVQVDANAIAVQTESAESGGTISAKEVANLMLNGRNFQQLATLVPGVSSIKGTNQQVDEGYLGQTNLIVGGSSVEQTTYTIDGVYNMTPTALININITPSIDSINEFRVLKNAYSAKYGYAGSGQILIDTKSGTSAFHGSGYEYNRSNGFGVARPYSFSGQPVTLSSLHLNIFGFTLGGPVYIPRLYNTNHTRTFFFAGAEFKTNHFASSLARSQFTQSIRNGDLSNSYSGLGPSTEKVLKCDITCQNLLTARGLTQAQCFFADSTGVVNQLRPYCYDPVSAYFINPANNFFPLPNIPNAIAPAANFINNNPELDSQNDTIYRIDHNLNDKNLLTFRYMHEEVNDIRPSRNFNNPAPNPGATVYTPSLNALARWNYTITPTIINTASIAYTYQKVQLNPTGQYNIPGGLIKQAFNNGDNRLPGVIISSPGTYWSWLGIGAQPNYSKTGDGIFSDDFTWVKGRHVIQAGGFYMWNILRLNATAFSQGLFNFSSTHTNDVAGDFLLGLTSSYSQSNVQRTGVFHQHWYEMYAQDDFKVTPRLTLNYGLRYAFYSPSTKDGNDITNFNAASFDPTQAPVVTPGGSFASNPPVTATGGIANITTNGIVKACTTGTPCGFTTPKKSLFSPRVGFALRLNSQGTLSLHGGYGIGYTQVGMFQTSGLLSNSPYVSTPSFSNTQFSNPAGGATNPPGLLSLSGLDNTYQPTQIQSWSLTLENEIVPHGILTMAYAGQAANHIFSSGVDRNFPLATTTNNTPLCNASANNVNRSSSTNYDYDPCLNGSNSAAGAPQTFSNYYRPYQGYTAINSGVSIGISNYNALQTGFIYRHSDLQLNLAYTWSKSLSNQNQTNNSYGFNSNIGYQNPRNPNADYGLPNYDRPHVFTAAYVYELPFFRNSDSFFLRELLSHWGTSGLVTAQSGYANTVGLSSSFAGLASRPNLVGPIMHNSGSGKKNLGQAPLFTASAFAVPAWGYFGNARPGILRGPKEVSFAAAVNKTFPITERVGAQIRVEAFNVFNHPNISNINTTYNFNQSTNTNSFGYATGAGDMRQMEFSGRITF
jgi:hypothetical protein